MSVTVSTTSKTVPGIAVTMLRCYAATFNSKVELLRCYASTVDYSATQTLKGMEATIRNVVPVLRWVLWSQLHQKPCQVEFYACRKNVVLQTSCLQTCSLYVDWLMKIIVFTVYIYRKILIISPGLIFVQKAFLLGLFSGELIFEGAYYWREFCVSKWVGLDNKNSQH